MIIAANWKAYVVDLEKAKQLLATSKKLARTYKGTIVLAPPTPLLGALASGNKSKVAFAAQDVSLTTGGAHTGEVLASMYATVGARYAIVGHSERRAAGDTNAVVVEKIRHILACGLTPILCIGEQEHDAEGRYLAFVREEITTALSSFTQKERSQFILAYEPIWAIGKSSSAAMDPNDLTEMVLYIRKVLAELIPGKAATRIPILYGGSVEPTNILDLARSTHIDGFLIGHASVDVATFTALIKAIS